MKKFFLPFLFLIALIGSFVYLQVQINALAGLKTEKKISKTQKTEKVVGDSESQAQIYYDDTSKSLILEGAQAGDVDFFSQDAGNYFLKIYGNITSAGGTSFASMGLTDLYDDFETSVADGNASTTLNYSVKLDDSSGNSVFRIKNSDGSEVAHIDSQGNLYLSGGIEASGACSCSGGFE